MSAYKHKWEEVQATGQDTSQEEKGGTRTGGTKKKGTLGTEAKKSRAQTIPKVQIQSWRKDKNLMNKHE